MCKTTRESKHLTPKENIKRLHEKEERSTKRFGELVWKIPDLIEKIEDLELLGNHLSHMVNERHNPRIAKINEVLDIPFGQKLGEVQSDRLNKIEERLDKLDDGDHKEAHILINSIITGIINQLEMLVKIA